MKLRNLLLLVPLLLTMCIGARAQVQPVQAALNTASTGNCTPASCLAYTIPSGVGSVSVSVVGSSGTVVFEVVDINGNYAGLNVTPSTSTTQVTSASVSGTNFYQANVAGFSTFRVRLTASGSAAVVINPSTASARSLGGGGGWSGTVTSVSGTANQVDVATGTTTPVISLDSALQLPGTVTSAQAGALTNAPFLFTGAPVTGGSGTTTVPLWYFNAGASNPTTWNTAGTLIGYNAPSGWTGSFLDYHINGGTSLFSVSGPNGNIFTAGTVTASSNILAGAQIGANGASLLNGGTNGVWKATNFAANGFTRFSLGPDTTSFPGFCPITGTTPYLAINVAGGCTTGTFVKTAQSLAVTGSDFSCTTGCTSLATITGLSVALPSIATNWSFDCNLIVSQATAAATDQVGVQTATNAPTNLAATGTVYTAAAVSTSASIVAVSSTSSQSVVTFTPGATGTNLPIHLAGTVEGTSTSGTTLNIQILTGSSSDAITIRRGSACWVY